MKKLIVVFMFIVFCLIGCKDFTTTRDKLEKTQKEMEKNSLESIPIPIVSYFQEKRTIAKWSERWDKPAIVTYVYLISYGNIIGYYVADGKPASTRSYLVPEERIDYAYGGGGFVLSSPDIDGTYGENNPGIRFFTAEGTAVEWGGSGASYIYSDSPLPIKVQKLNYKQQ